MPEYYRNSKKEQGGVLYFRDANFTLSAPYSQLAGSIYLNNSNIISDTFNIGDYGKLYVSTSGNNALIESQNTTFSSESTIGKRIIIVSDDLASDTIERVFLKSYNDIADTNSLLFDVVEGKYVPNDSNMEQILPNIRNFWGQNAPTNLGILG